MSNSNDANDGLKLTDRATLMLLSALENEGQVTQRGLAARIGVALGLTNSLLKRAVHKGLVKVQQAPAKRYVYYVTPKGLGEKSRLVVDYLSSSLDFFRQARAEYSDVFDAVKNSGHTRVVLFGEGELAEIATLFAQNSDVKLSAVIQTGSNQELFSGLPVLPNIEAALSEGADAVVVACSTAPQGAYDTLRAHFDDDCIYTAPLLHITRGVNGEGD